MGGEFRVPGRCRGGDGEAAMDHSNDWEIGRQYSGGKEFYASGVLNGGVSQD